MRNEALRTYINKNKLDQYIIGFTESLISFLFVTDDMQGLQSETKANMISMLVEYSIIYFPTFKCVELAETLETENAISKTFLNTQLELLNHRDSTSLKNLAHWVKNSRMMAKLVEYTLSVLKSDDMILDNPVGMELINKSESILNSIA